MKVNFSKEIRDKSNNGLGTRLGNVLLGCFALLPKEAQSDLNESISKKRNADGETVVDVSLTVEGKEMPLGEFCESLYERYERMTAECAREIIQEECNGIEQKLRDLSEQLTELFENKVKPEVGAIMDGLKKHKK